MLKTELSLATVRPAASDVPPSPAPSWLASVPDTVDIIKRQTSPSSSSLARLELQEIPLDQIKNARSDGRVIPLPIGVGVGFRIQKAVYGCDDTYISDDPLRTAAANTIAASGGQEVRWVETGGLAEVGGGFTMAFPILQFPSHLGTFGANCGGLNHNMAIYRVLKPYAGKSSAEIDALLADSRFRFPASTDAAKNLPLGSEYEMVGQTTLREDAALGLRCGPTAGPITTGFYTGVNVDGSYTRLGAVRVTALDGKNRVRVLVRDLSQVIDSQNVAFQIGVIFGSAGIVPFPFNPTLKYVSEQQGFHYIESLITWYTSMTFKLTRRHTVRETTLCSFDFDLSNPCIKEAYEGLFRFDLTMANKLSTRPGSGVEKVEFREHEVVAAKVGTIGLVGQRALLSDVSSITIDGAVQNRDHGLLYKERCFSKTFSSLLTASKEVQWQQVKVYRSGAKGPEEYFHFHYSRVDQGVSQGDVDSFMQFARTMGIQLRGDTCARTKEIPFLRRLINKEGQMKFELDLFFNTAAVRSLENASGQVALSAYLKAASELDPIYAELPMATVSGDKLRRVSELIAAYRRWKSSSVWSLARISALDAIEKEYSELTGRLISIDDRVYRRAKNFAEKVAKIKNVSSASEITLFFTALGKSEQFSYMESIVALTHIVGRCNCLVHSLSIDGDGTKVAGSDEGFIAHPRDQAYAAIYGPDGTKGFGT